MQIPNYLILLFVWFCNLSHMVPFAILGERLVIQGLHIRGHANYIGLPVL